MKKNEKRSRWICLFLTVIMAILSVCFANMEAKKIMHISDLKPASASLISSEFSRSTRNSAEELNGLSQVSLRLETDQRLRLRGSYKVGELVIIMLALLLASTIFYKEKKQLLLRNDAQCRAFIICYIHHQDGQKH